MTCPRIVRSSFCIAVSLILLYGGIRADEPTETKDDKKTESKDNKPTASKDDKQAADKPARMPVVAIIPPIDRGDPAYATLSPAFTSMLGSILEQSGRAIVVDRTSIGKVFSEKDLAEFKLSDRETLAKKGQLIGASHVISGYYDVRGGKVQLMVNLVDVYDWLHPVDANGAYRITPISAKLSSDELIEATETIAQAALKKLPEAPPSPSSNDKSSFAKGRSVAAFSLAACPRSEKLEHSAGLLTDMLATDIEQSLSMKLVEREKLENILAEKKMQFAGLTRRNQAMLAARLLGAEYLLTGGIVRAGEKLRVDIQLLDVATGAVVATASAETTAERLLETHGELARTLSQRVGPGVERLSRLAPSPADWRTAEAQIQGVWAEKLIDINSSRDAAFIAKVRALVRVALDLAPEDGLVNESAGVLAMTVGDRDAARRYLRKGVERGSDISVCHLRYSQFLLQYDRDTKQALEHARKAVELQGKNLPPEKLYSTLPPEFCRTIARCLLATGQVGEAEKWVAYMVEHTDRTSKTIDIMVDVLKAQGKYREAADLLKEIGTQEPARIDELLKLAGQTPEKQQRLMAYLRRNRLNTNDRLLLAELSETSNPELAAMICRAVITNGGCIRERPRPPSDPSVGYQRSDYYYIAPWVHPRVSSTQATKAREILEEMGQTPEMPLVTGPVFDIEALREKGIKYALLKYENFPYEEQLPYIIAYLEDVYGIPIVTNEDFRPLPEGSFIKSQGIIMQENNIDRDLIRGQRDMECAGVTGLMGFPMSTLEKRKYDLILFSTPRSMVSTTHCASRTPSTHAANTFIVGSLLRNLSYCVGTRIRPYKVLRAVAPFCPVQSCVIALCNTREQEMVPCPVCRKEIYEIRKGWTKGATEREPIVAGPTEPAMADAKQAGEVLLVPMNISAEDAHLDQVAQALSASLGLRCKIHERIDRGDNIPAIPKSLAEISLELDGADKQFAAVCVLTGKRFSEKPWNEMLIGEPPLLSPRRWRVWIPGLDEPGPKTECPLIVMSVADKREFNLPYRYRRMETFSVEKDGQKVAIQAPAYSKLLIGALAVAARKDRECWTLGCPTTVWETIGIPHRCSHFLCPKCRKAVAEYYKKIEK